MAKGFIPKEWGKWFVLIGVIASVLAGFNWITGALVTGAIAVLGILTGLVNIEKHERLGYMIAVGAIGAASAGLAALPAIGTFLTGLLASLGTLFLTALAPVALMEIYDKIKD